MWAGRFFALLAIYYAEDFNSCVESTKSGLVASKDELLNCELSSLIRTGVARGVADQQEVREIETKLKMRGITARFV